MWATPAALSLLCDLCYELLGYRLPMSDVSCLFWCVLNQTTALGANPTGTAMGIAFIWQIARTFSINSNSVTIANFGTPYYAISISLNVLLTLMIVARLILHRKNIRKAMGTRAGGLYGTAATMLVESCALYAVSYILFIGPWAIGSPVSNIFFPILAETQVRALLCFSRAL